MDYNPEIHHRRSIRLRGYDYSQPGMYFVTICTQGKEHLFGEVVDGEMNASEYGLIVSQCWHDLPNHYHHAQTDSFVLMPNHVHGIIAILPRNPVERRGGFTNLPPIDPAHRRGGFTNPPRMDGTRRRGGFTNPPLHSLAEIVRGFKTYSARRINRIRGNAAQPVWQRNYYEHIVRNDDELNKIREYIQTNPLRWLYDRENIPPRVSIP
jgi:putative transposase